MLLKTSKLGVISQPHGTESNAAFPIQKNILIGKKYSSRHSFIFVIFKSKILFLYSRGGLKWVLPVIFELKDLKFKSKIKLRISKNPKSH